MKLDLNGRRILIVLSMLAALGIALPLHAADEPCDGIDNDEDALLDEGCLARCDEIDGSTVATRLTFRSLPISRAQVIWNGSEFATVWHEGFTGSREIWFRRWDRLGKGLGTSVNVSNAAGESSFPRMVWTGSQYLVVWEEDRDGNDEIYLRAIDDDGVPVGAPIRLTSTVLPSQDPAIAYNPSANRWGIAYVEGGDVHVNVQGFTGTITYPTSPRNPKIAWAGNEFGVTWEDRISFNNDIYFHRVSALNAAPISGHVRLTSATTADVTPSIAWTGTQYVVAWSGGVGGGEARMFYRRVGPAGEIGSSYGFVTQGSVLGDAQAPSVVATGSQFAIAWEDDFDDTNDFEIFVRTFEESGVAAGDSIQVTSTAPEDFAANPSLVWTGGEMAVAFGDNRISDTEIWLERLGCCNDLDEDGYTSCEGDSLNLDPLANPRATEVCDGIDNNTNGTVDEVCNGVCGAPLPDVGPAHEIDDLETFGSNLFWTGDEYLALWSDQLRRLGPDGTPLDSPVDLGVLVVQSNAMWNGGEVVGFSGSPGNVLFHRFDRFGVELSSVPVTSGFLGVSLNDVDLAWNGSEYMAVYRSGVSFDSIYALRFDAEGNEIGGVVNTGLIAIAGFEPAVEWNGSQWLIAYVVGGPQLLVNRLRWDGTVVPNGAALTTIVTGAEAYARHPQLFGAAGVINLVWDYRISAGMGLGVRLAQLTTAGALLGIANVADRAGASNADATWTGEEYAVVWTDYAGAVDDVVNLQRIDGSLNNVGTRVRITPPSEEGSHEPTVGWSGSSYGVLHGTPDALEFRHLVCCLQTDGDGDGYGDGCDCAPADPFTYPGAVERCDAVDNGCNGQLPADEADDDGDCYLVCSPYVGDPAAACGGGDPDPGGRAAGATIQGGGDCDDTNSQTYPGAVEYFDGYDNQCGGEPGHGMIDEVTSGMWFLDAGNILWNPVFGSDGYELLRSSDDVAYLGGCDVLVTPGSSVFDNTVPDPGVLNSYLIRAYSGNLVGSLGGGAAGERFPTCAP